MTITEISVKNCFTKRMNSTNYRQGEGMSYLTKHDQKVSQKLLAQCPHITNITTGSLLQQSIKPLMWERLKFTPRFAWVNKTKVGFILQLCAFVDL